MTPEHPGAAAVKATVILVHGGREFGTRPVRRFDLPVLRIELFRVALWHRLRQRGVVVRRLRFAQQGWNHDGADAIADLCAFVDEIANGPGAKVILVGHSMGGRTALRLVDHPAVLGVIGLAPWLPFGEPLGNVARRWVLIAHGDADRTTNPAASLDYVQRALSAGARGRHVVVAGEGHALLRHRRWWNRYILDSVDEIRSSD